MTTALISLPARVTYERAISVTTRCTAIADILATKLRCNAFEVDRALIERHQLGSLHDLGELIVAKAAHAVGAAPGASRGVTGLPPPVCVTIS